MYSFLPPAGAPARSALPADVLELLEQIALAPHVPEALGSAFSEAEQADVRLLSLLAHRDVQVLARLLCRANSQEPSARTEVIFRAEEAIRQVGPSTAFSLVTQGGPGEAQGLDPWPLARLYVFRYAASMILTARRIGTWLSLPPADAAMLQFTAKLTPVGLAIGVGTASPLGRRFVDRLSLMGAGADLRAQDALKGFCSVSAQAALGWGCPATAANVVEDSARSSPDTLMGRLLALAEELVHNKSFGLAPLTWKQLEDRAIPGPPRRRPDVPGRPMRLDLGVWVR